MSGVREIRMLGKESKTSDNAIHGNENQKKNLLIPGKIHLKQEKSIKVKKTLPKSRKSPQNQVKRVMIKKNSTNLREPHKDIIQRTQVTTKKQIPLPYGTQKNINQMIEIGHNKIP
jgi:hypothetical protein